MDEYRQEMHDLRLDNDRLRKANGYLKSATNVLRKLNRRLRVFQLNVA
jgi:hypothetical protein